MPASEIMPKFKEGDLHSGSPEGPVVKSKKQAKAIQLSYLRKEGKISSAPPKTVIKKKGPRKTV